jgi:hypothetical protein
MAKFNGYVRLPNQKLMLHLSLGFLLYIPYDVTNKFARSLQMHCKVNDVLKAVWYSVFVQIIWSGLIWRTDTNIIFLAFCYSKLASIIVFDVKCLGELYFFV